MTTLEQALAYARANRPAHLSGLCDWLRIPSISTLPEHLADVRRAGQFAAERLHEIGFRRAALRETDGHPILYAEWLEADAPTVRLDVRILGRALRIWSCLRTFRYFVPVQKGKSTCTVKIRLRV